MLNEKVDFDLSLLSLEELIEVFNDIDSFIQYLNDSKIEEEKEDENE
jgi:hypothetical protein